MTPCRLPSGFRFAGENFGLHPDPPELWHRVMVIGETEPAHLRHCWPHATVVAQLLHVSFISMLLRVLYFNPTIRAVTVNPPNAARKKVVPQLSPAILTFGQLWGACHGPQPMDRVVLDDVLNSTGPEGQWEAVTHLLEEVTFIWPETWQRRKDQGLDPLLFLPSTDRSGGSSGEFPPHPEFVG